MKRLLTFISIIFLFVGCAGFNGVQAPEEDRSYEKIVETPDLSRDKLWVKANSWAVSVFKQREGVVQFQDKEQGTIIGKFIFTDIDGAWEYKFKQKIRVDVKENKARLVINEPRYLAWDNIWTEPYERGSGHNYEPLKTKEKLSEVRKIWKDLGNKFEEHLTSNTESNW